MDDAKISCPECGGEGRIKRKEYLNGEMVYWNSVCRLCDGFKFISMRIMNNIRDIIEGLSNSTIRK